MKIATWNVNSITVRLPHVLDWLEENQTRCPLPAGDEVYRR
jgi:exonuclease III